MNEKLKTVCTNCKYFKQYYIIGVDYKFKPVYDGFCVNYKVKANNKFTKYNLGCDLWQPNELQKLEFYYGIQERLQDLLDNIENYIAVLRSLLESAF